MATWDDVVAIGKGLPEVEESTWYSTPALKLRGRGLCRLRMDPGILVMRVLDIEDQQALVRGEPEVFFTVPHYEGHPYVLVRLEVVSREQLAELIEDAWRLMTGG